MITRRLAASAAILASVAFAASATAGCSKPSERRAVISESTTASAMKDNPSVKRRSKVEHIPELGSLDPSLWVNGPPIELKNLHGRVVLIETWSRFCTLCKASVPAVKALQERYAGKGVEVLGVARYEGEPGEREAIQQTMTDLDMTYRSFLDKGMVWHQKAEVQGSYPYFYVVSKAGSIMLRESGRIAEGTPGFARITAAIDNALAT